MFGVAFVLASRAQHCWAELTAASRNLHPSYRFLACRRVLIYSQFTRTLDILEEWVVGRGWGFERIDGETS